MFIFSRIALSADAVDFINEDHRLYLLARCMAEQFFDQPQMTKYVGRIQYSKKKLLTMLKRSPCSPTLCKSVGYRKINVNDIKTSTGVQIPHIFDFNNPVSVCSCSAHLTYFFYDKVYHDSFVPVTVNVQLALNNHKFAWNTEICK